MENISSISEDTSSIAKDFLSNSGNNKDCNIIKKNNKTIIKHLKVLHQAAENPKINIQIRKVSLSILEREKNM